MHWLILVRFLETAKTVISQKFLHSTNIYRAPICLLVGKYLLSVLGIQSFEMHFIGRT